MNPIYETALACARIAAYGQGYAVSLHGSGTRDLDLIAIPWTVRATDTRTLVGAILSSLQFEFGSTEVRMLDSMTGRWPDSVQKPHGRVAFTIMIGASLHVDLSVMPRTSSSGLLTQPHPDSLDGSTGV